MGENTVLPSHIQDALDAIAELHRQHHRRTTPVQRMVVQLTNVVAQPRFVGLLTLGLAAWVAANGFVALAGLPAPDPPPFGYLQVITAISAIYITLLILITQRRENELSEARDQLTLELAMLNEQKSAKIVSLLEELRRDLPSAPNRHDPEAELFSAPSDHRAVMEAIRTLAEELPEDAGGLSEP
jgi:uncharacterized membrane protein